MLMKRAEEEFAERIGKIETVELKEEVDAEGLGRHQIQMRKRRG